MRQPQLEDICNVPSVTPAATMAPMNQEALKSEPILARSFGYASSPIMEDAATMAKGMPKPSRNRATTNIATNNKGEYAKFSDWSIMRTVLRRCLQRGSDDHDDTAE